MKIKLCQGLDDVATHLEDTEMLVLQMESEADIEDYFKIKECILKNSYSDSFKKMSKEISGILKGGANMATDKEILEMDINALRIAMIGRGWNSQDKLSTIGWGDGFGYSILFERWDWQGKRGIKVVFHSSTQDMDKIDETIRGVAKMALDAWNEHKGTVPTQTADGTVVVEPFMTKLLQKK